MKNFKILLFIITAALGMSGCEDVVDVKLNTAPPRLVIDAAINWQKGTSGSVQRVKLTTTTGYYQTTAPAVSGAAVFITGPNGVVFNFIEVPDTGEYVCENFVPVLLADYTLTVQSGGQTYTAKETLNPVVPIDRIDQRNDGGFSGSDIEIKVFFTDKTPAVDYYLLRYSPSFAAIPIFDIESDEYFQGNQFSDFYSSEDLESGQTIGVSLYGISKTYYNYMNILRNSAGGGSPFDTASANVRGNIINTTEFNNYALGYFSIAEVDQINYTVK
jgi:hypothetical protein